MLAAFSSQSRFCFFGLVLRFAIGPLRVPMWFCVWGGSATCVAWVVSLVLRRPLLCFRNSSCLGGFARCFNTRLGGSFRGITSLPLLWTARACCGTWLGGLLESSPLSCCQMKTKGLGFFLNPRLHCMIESAFPQAVRARPVLRMLYSH
ncbi:hypothetical protein CISIN_1g032029mg [Citrus sinensis]|uniref:Uncharacterized protein n=1 Tax=Citrus sinensis TaxID=2711 RepID=A0A067DVG5_CITSI|nr:hypothetical protein CISIN_1g032029mg [Citrus sinensis]